MCFCVSSLIFALLSDFFFCLELLPSLHPHMSYCFIVVPVLHLDSHHHLCFAKSFWNSIGHAWERNRVGSSQNVFFTTAFYFVILMTSYDDLFVDVCSDDLYLLPSPSHLSFCLVL